jgi:uroporphyrinogen-III decarboxylase
MAVVSFGNSHVQQTLEALGQAGKEAVKWRAMISEINNAVMAKGFPSFSGGFTKAPFDVIGDSLRGTTGVMLDMFRHPDELKEACERLTPIMIKAGVNGCNASGNIMPFSPLHKGADGFMSDKQFETFYWPTLRKLIIGLINEGLVPQLFAEGSYNKRLEMICDIPKGKALWWFDRTDMKRAKETVGKISCIAGNVPVYLLSAGTAEEIHAYCIALIQNGGKNGGFIFSTGAGMQGAKIENVRTMMDIARQKSAYR